MKSLGKANTKDELIALLRQQGDPEFVELRPTKVAGISEGVYVSYNPKTKTGKFHHYVSVEAPTEIFKEL